MSDHEKFPSTNATALLSNRQRDADGEPIIRQKLFATRNMIKSLGRKYTLEGHSGCVNSLQFSTDGSLLASGSDDNTVILWDPLLGRKLNAIRTAHQGNIFSVQFRSHNNNQEIVTGAGDGRMLTHDVLTKDQILDCHCHGARIKRICTSELWPHIVFSGSEDGTVRRTDLRQPHRCASHSENNVIVDIKHSLHSAKGKVKTIALNPTNKHILAVGSDDPIARIYDLRMMRAGTANNAQGYQDGCLQFFAPGHYHTYDLFDEELAITHLTFNHSGTELLVNLGADHVYLFDTVNPRETVFVKLPESVESTASAAPLPPEIEELKVMASRHLNAPEYLKTIELYDMAIHKCPTKSAVLHLNRATVFLRRKWVGDAYCALMDCQKALAIKPNYMKAYYRMAQALLALKLYADATHVLRTLVRRFPEEQNNHGVVTLMCTITDEQRINSEGILDETARMFRPTTLDYHDHFVGACNTVTDIKEANFIGPDSKFVVAGSDCGNFFVWERPLNNIVHYQKANSNVLNCVQIHPHTLLMATSGIDSEVLTWQPGELSEVSAETPLPDHYDLVDANQQKLDNRHLLECNVM